MNYILIKNSALKIIQFYRSNSRIPWTGFTEVLSSESNTYCLFWTIGALLKVTKSIKVNDLERQTIFKYKSILDERNKEISVHQIDKLAWKNWENRINNDEEIDYLNLVLARLGWACIPFLCHLNKNSYVSKIRNGNSCVYPVVENQLTLSIKYECAYCLHGLFNIDEVAMMEAVSEISLMKIHDQK